MNIKNTALFVLLILTLGISLIFACSDNDDEEDESNCGADDDDDNDDSKKVDECCFILCQSGSKTAIGYYEMDEVDCEIEAENFCSDKDTVEMYEFDPDCGELCGCAPPEWY